MEPSIPLAIAAVVLLIVGWVIFKFFFRLLKHFILATILAVIVAIAWYQPWNFLTPAKDPNIGKFAYGVSSGNFVGVVVADDKDDNSWVVEKGGMKTKYAKGRVVLKDREK